MTPTPLTDAENPLADIEIIRVIENLCSKLRDTSGAPPNVTHCELFWYLDAIQTLRARAKPTPMPTLTDAEPHNWHDTFLDAWSARQFCSQCGVRNTEPASKESCRYAQPAPDLPDSDPLSWRSWKTLGPPGETYVVWRARMEKEAAYDARKNDPRYVTVSAPTQPAPEPQAAQDVFEAVAMEIARKYTWNEGEDQDALAALLRERFGPWQWLLTQAHDVLYDVEDELPKAAQARVVKLRQALGDLPSTALARLSPAGGLTK